MTRATLRYTIDNGIKPVNKTVGPGGRLRERSGGLEDDHEVEVADGRAAADSLVLDREGFELVSHPTAVSDFWDEPARRAVYDAEVERLVADRTGASRVVVFDHTVRSTDPSKHEAHHAREPVQLIHNDYTEWSGPQRVRDVLPDEAEALLSRRFAIVQVWRPTGPPIEQFPLALCDARSLDAADLIAAERRHPNRVGEIYQVSYSPRHRWYGFAGMRRDEALVFKVFDSRRDVARFTAHTSYADPSTPAEPAPRESIEVRTLAFFD
ncbi:MAG: CmcJ/NvfI family oxidoreductase [Myxococcota bacterium]